MSQQDIDISPHMHTQHFGAFMSKPLFVYEVKSTSWCIVVTENAGHFYFDTATKKSVWQLDETGLDPATFVASVSFDDLGVLFARANGFCLKEESTKVVGEKNVINQINDKLVKEEGADIDDDRDIGLLDEEEEVDGDVGDDEYDDGENDDEQMLRQILQESGYLPDPSDEAPAEENGNDQEEIQSQEPKGLSLGYSSLEEGSEAEDQAEHESCGNVVPDQEASTDSKPELDLSIPEKELEPETEALDLSLGETSSSAENNSKFIALLEKHKNAISVYDPWFVVEEELLSQLVQDPAYYAVPEAQRESLFNEWVSPTASGKHTARHDRYPTPLLRYYQFLQEHKSQVRKLYFPEFYREHLSEFQTMHFGSLKPEDEYRRLRVTLTDFALYERRAKKGVSAGASNLKLEYVRDFVAKQLAHHRCSPPQVPENGSWFDRWILLCNQCNLPEKVVNDPTNFIVGDEKRFTCYVSVLQNT